MNMKKIKCPYCNEKIDAGLEVCPICYEKLPQEDNIQNEQNTDCNDVQKTDRNKQQTNNHSKIITIILCIVTILFVGSCIGLFVTYNDEVANFIFRSSYLDKGIRYYNNNDF